MRKMTKDELTATLVAVASFAISAAHIYKVTKEAGNPALLAALHPFALDGLVFVGIRAMQSGRKGIGFLALLYGTTFSLLFNADAYDAIKMHDLLIAASIPVATILTFVVAHATPHEEPEPEVRIEERIVEVVKEIEVPVEVVKIVEVVKEIEVPVEKRIEIVRAPELLPIVPFTPKQRTRRAPRPKVDASPSETKTDAAPATGGGRVAAWDVEGAVRLYGDGRTDEEIVDASGAGAKPWQRTKRAIRLLADSTMPVEEIASVCGVSPSHVLRIRKALAEKEIAS